MNLNLQLESGADHEFIERQEREYYLAHLMFAARNLAEMQFTRHGRLRADGSGTDPICTECRRVQTSAARLDHEDHCRAGRVLRVLEALVEGAPIPTPHERMCGEEAAYEPMRGGAGERPRALPESIALGYERIHEMTKRAVSRCRTAEKMVRP